MRAPREFGRLGALLGHPGASKLDLGRFPEFRKIRPEKVIITSEIDFRLILVMSIAQTSRAGESRRYKADKILRRK